MGLGHVQPLVLGPTALPEITDPAVAEQEVELALLSAVTHGNGPNGLAVLRAALVALSRFDREHAAAYFQVIWNVLRRPTRRALEAMVMERQTEGTATFPPFIQKLIDRGIQEGRFEGRLEGLREALLRLMARAGLTLTEDDRARIQACDDPTILDQWVENVLGAKTAADVFD